jgi:DNA-binding transcriptional LysR family regulator
MNLQQLRYLVAAADTGSLSGAARIERVSQPVVSRALHNLEREYSVQLLRLDGRRLALTDAGEAVVAAARQAVEAAEDVARAARRFSQGSELTLAATPGNTALLTTVLTSFMKRRPDTALRVQRAAAMGAVRQMVSAGQADIGFGDLYEVREHPSLWATPIWTAEVVLVSPIGAKLPRIVPRTLLSSLRLVLPSAGSERRQWITRLITDAGGNEPSAAFATDERGTWISSAQQGIGSFLCYRAVACELDDVEVRGLDPSVDAAVGFIHRCEPLTAEGAQLVSDARDAAIPVGCTPAVANT